MIVPFVLFIASDMIRAVQNVRDATNRITQRKDTAVCAFLQSRLAAHCATVQIAQIARNLWQSPHDRSFLLFALDPACKWLLKTSGVKQIRPVEVKIRQFAQSCNCTLQLVLQTANCKKGVFVLAISGIPSTLAVVVLMASGMSRASQNTTVDPNRPCRSGDTAAVGAVCTVCVVESLVRRSIIHKW